MSFLPHSVSQGSYIGLPGFKEKQRRSQLDRRKPASQFKKSKWDRIDIGRPPLEKHTGCNTCVWSSTHGVRHPVCMKQGSLVHQRTERLLRANGFYSTDETENPRLCEPLHHSPTLGPIGLSHHQPLRLGEEALFSPPDLHTQAFYKGKHTHLRHLTLPPFSNSTSQ